PRRDRRGAGYPAGPAGPGVRAVHPRRARRRAQWRHRTGAGHRAVGGRAARRQHLGGRRAAARLPDPGHPAGGGVMRGHWPGPHWPASRTDLLSAVACGVVAALTLVLSRPGIGWLIAGLAVAGTAVGTAWEA